MTNLRSLLSQGALHHAYVIEGEKESVLKQLISFFERDLGVTLANNPDYWHGEFATFGIDEARELRERQSRASAESGSRKIFVVSAGRLTVEAQNALLKTLEEPTAGTHIFIILPSMAEVLPTVRSRAIFLRVGDDVPQEKAKTFLASSYAEREKVIKSFPEEENRARASELIHELQRALKEKLKKKSDALEYHQSFFALEKCRAHLGGRAPSVKMLLEYLAVVLLREKSDSVA